MDLWPLPDAWEWKRLGSVAGDTERRNPGVKPDEYFRYVDIASVDNEKGEIRTGDVQSILGRSAPSRARKVIKEHDIIFATTRPYLRNIAVVPKELDGQICSTGFCVVRARSGISLPDFLYYACRSSFFIEQLLPKQRGATYPAVADNEVYDTLLPLPYPDDPARSLETQRRIVARIEALFAELREARRLHDEIVADTGRVMEAAVSQVLDDGIRNNWEWTTVGSLMLGTPQYGTSRKPNSERRGVPILRMGNIQDGELDLTGLKHVDLPEAEVRKYRLQKGDLVFNRTNSAELVGKTAVFESDEATVCASYLIRFRVDLKRAAPKFVSFYINSPLGRRYIETQLVRAIGQVNVNAQKLGAMPIPIPPVRSDQDKAVEYIEHMKQEVREIRAAQTDDVTLLNDLEQSILAQAFRGDL